MERKLFLWGWLLLVLGCSCSSQRYWAFKVESDPPGAQVQAPAYNRYLGDTPTKIQLVRHKKGEVIKPSFLIEKKGYHAEQKIVNVEQAFKTEDEARQKPHVLRVNLSRSIPEVLMFSSEPAGASVFLGAKFIGITPFEANLSEALVFESTLRFEKSGFLSQEVEIPVDYNKVHAVLQPMKNN